MKYSVSRSKDEYSGMELYSSRYVSSSSSTYCTWIYSHVSLRDYLYEFDSNKKCAKYVKKKWRILPLQLLSDSFRRALVCDNGDVYEQ